MLSTFVSFSIIRLRIQESANGEFKDDIEKTDELKFYNISWCPPLLLVLHSPIYNTGINTKMQSYSPPALSLSNQSSLPVLVQRKLLTFSLTYELGNTLTCY